MRETKSVQQLIGDVCRAIRLDFQADGITATPFPLLKFNRLQQIVGFFLVEVEIAIPGYPKLVSTLDFHAMEERTHMCLDQVANETLTVHSALARLVRQ